MRNVIEINELKKTYSNGFCALKGIRLVEIPYTEENLISYDYILEKAGY